MRIYFVFVQHSTLLNTSILKYSIDSQLKAVKELSSKVQYKVMLGVGEMEICVLYTVYIYL